MNKKFKKLMTNPKKFIIDSAILKKLKAKRNLLPVDIAFIVLGDSDTLISESIESINLAASKAKLESVEVMIVTPIVDSMHVKNYASINLAVEDAKSPFIKIMNQGDLINSNFISAIRNSEADHADTDLILTSFTENVAKANIDPLCEAIAAKNLQGSLNNAKLAVFPMYFGLIFNKELFHKNPNLFSEHGVKYELDNCLSLLKTVDISNKKYQNLKHCVTARHSGERLHEFFMDIAKDATSIFDCLDALVSYSTLSGLTKLTKNAMYYFLHCIVLTYLKNKKPDEMLSLTEQSQVFEKMLSIINKYDSGFIKGFTSSNYNHVHKVGYLSLIHADAPFNMCYLEDIDEANNQIKLKLVYQDSVLPEIHLNGKEIIPSHIKTKVYSIFDKPFSFENFIWVAYKNIEDQLSIKSKITTEFLISGKKHATVNIKQAKVFFEKKKELTVKLPLKVKTLRFASQITLVRRKYKNCWLFVDNDLRADDNAEHFYRYVSTQKSHINSYFLLSKKSKDWNRLKGEGFKLIPFGGLRHRLSLINADKILSSHANPAITNYLPKKHFLDIFKHKFVFLQHGITKDDQSEWLNSRNIHHLVTAAYPEYSDISSDGRYKYTSKETILSGFPRYDALYGKGVDSKLILIMPTWRKSLTGEFIGKTSKRAKNPNFNSSLFCKMWGGLLASEELKCLVAHHGYKVMYFPHPNLIDYQDDLNIPDYIEIADINKQSIQDIFRKTSVLLTDFSSVAFDVSYMNKAVLYFQFDTDSFFSEHSYSKGYYDYDEHGFGPVVDTIPSVITHLSEILQNDCTPSQHYLKRIADFFPYNDSNNSQRLFDALEKKEDKKANITSIIKKGNHYASIMNSVKLHALLMENQHALITANSYEFEIIDEMLSSAYVVAALVNNKTLSEVITKISSDSPNNSAIKWINNNRYDIYNYVNCIIKGENLSPTALDYFESIKINASVKELICSIIKCVLAYEAFDHNKSINVINNLSNVPLSYLPRVLLVKRINSLILVDDITAASSIAKLVSFSEHEKDLLMIELKIAHSPTNISKIESFATSHLIPTIDSSIALIDFYISCNKSKCSIDLYEYIKNGKVSSKILSTFVRNEYNNKKYNRVIETFNNKIYKDLVLKNKTNVTLILFSIYLRNGIVSFKDALINISKENSIEKALDKCVIGQSKLDLEVLYSIVNALEEHYHDQLSCSYVYKVALLLQKNNRPGLAKKLTSASLMNRHEKHYSQPSNWKSANDYHTLINAVNELNKISAS